MSTIMQPKKEHEIREIADKIKAEIKVKGISWKDEYGLFLDDDIEAVKVILQKSEEYEYSKSDSGFGYFYKNPKLNKPIYKKDWFIHIRNGLITAVFSLLVGWLLLQSKNRELSQLNNRIDSLIESQNKQTFQADSSYKSKPTVLPSIKKDTTKSVQPETLKK